MSRYIGKRIVPKHCGEWDKTKTYEMLSIVYVSARGDSFISKREVPSGTELTNTTYWALCAQFSNQVYEAVVELLAARDDMDHSSMVLNARMDSILSDASVDVDSEMKDARVDSEGTIYQCVGDALRSIFPAVNEKYSWLLEEIRTARRDQAGSVYPTLKERLDNENLTLVKEKLSLPQDEGGFILVGEAGQVAQSDGVGGMVWADPVKSFYDVQFDPDLRLLRFVDKDGLDCYDPVYIEGGGGGGGGGGIITSEVHLINNGAISFHVSSGDPVVLDFTFTSVDEGQETGDGYCTVSVNGVERAAFSIRQGRTTFDVGSYLQSGSNSIRVKCTDAYGNFKFLTYNASIMELYLASNFNPDMAFSGDIQFRYTAYGAFEKTTHILMDGKEVYSNTTSATGKLMTVTLPAQSHGSHLIDAYVTATVNGAFMESSHLLYDVVCMDPNDNTPIIASPYAVDTLSQGELVSIPYTVNTPNALNSSITLEITVAGRVYFTQNLTVGRTTQYWNTRQYPEGIVSFTIKCGSVSKTKIIRVTGAELPVEPVTNDLELYLTAAGRSNNEENPAVWEFNGHRTLFDGMNWDSTGWVSDENGDTVLRLSGGATAEIQFQPFASDWKTNGKTIELEFAIHDVNNRNAVVMECMNGGIGFAVTADTTYLSSEQTKVSCNYCDEEKIRISFVAERRNEYRLLEVYLNGVLSGAKQYPLSDNFQQATPVSITIGSPYCGIDLYTIRCYSSSLSATEVVHNYIADMTDVVKRQNIYDENNIYNEYGQLSYLALKDRLPVMTIIGELPQSKGDKKQVRIKFEHNEDRELDFEDTATIDVQGTSSQWYVRKNYKDKFSEAHLHMRGEMPNKVFTVKADYAESTSTHNTQNANLIGTLYTEKTPAQKVDERCRTTIAGYPIVIYHQADAESDPEFIGKYNFNFDKGSAEVFGFTEAHDVESWEFLNNTSDACNFLANVGEDWADSFEARYPEDCTDLSRFKIMHDWVVSTKGNVTKFRNEFTRYFNLHFALIYYVYTFVMLMVDQRAKNMFLTYWAETGKWEPWFYDNDTCLGINNEGQLVFDYYHEDTDQLDGANVYNGQNSTLWCNFREAFAEEIKTTYQTLRSEGKLTAEKVMEYFITNGSKKWCASIYNEDSDFKYISMLRSDGDASNLYQIRGTGEEHLRYFIRNRLNYCDSKWYASSYANDYVSLRIYTPKTYGVIAPNADITVIPFSHMYAGVRYKANGSLMQKRAIANDPCVFTAPNEVFNDTETAVYGASQISSLGDLAPLYCGSVNVSKATKLVRLKVGDESAGYSNPNLTELSVGTNRLLKLVDVRNCPNLRDALDLSGCANMEEIYATGTNISGVELPTSGYLKILRLPAVRNLTLRNQRYLREFSLESYDNLTTMNIENCPIVDVLDILENAPNLQRVRIIGVDWELEDASLLMDLIYHNVGGIDESGYNTETIQVSGVCRIHQLAMYELAMIRAKFPYLTFVYDVSVSTARNLVGRTLDGHYYNMSVTNLGGYALCGCKDLISVEFPNVTKVGESAFAGCRSLAVLQMARVTSIGKDGFKDCRSLTRLSFPQLTAVNSSFSGCRALERIDCGKSLTIAEKAFSGCENLTAVILRADRAVDLADPNAFEGTPIEGGTGYLYVLRDLISSYQRAEKWSAYASQFRPIEDYPNI